MKENTITKEHQTIMLPTNIPNKVNQLCKFAYGLAIATVADIGYPAQHLYFISDELIKEGDWVINIMHSAEGVSKIGNEFADEITISYVQARTDRYKKVIATTNPDLWWKDTPMGHKYSGIPKINTTFIEAYVKEQGKIDKVLLEYFTAFVAGNYMNTCSICKQDFNGTDKLGFVCPNHPFLKLKSNGFVIVHPVKEKMYSKKELIAFSVWHSGMKTEQVERAFNRYLIEQHL